MTEANSPTFKQGIEDGTADTERASACPPQAVIGPQPPSPAYPVMYNRGYERAFNPCPCVCDGSCKRRR
jgi:hypothetical protein